METCISIRLNPNNVHHPKRINSPDLEANENHTLDGEILPYRKNASTLEELGEIKQWNQNGFGSTNRHGDFINNGTIFCEGK